MRRALQWPNTITKNSEKSLLSKQFEKNQKITFEDVAGTGRPRPFRLLNPVQRRLLPAPPPSARRVPRSALGETAPRDAPLSPLPLDRRRSEDY